MFEILFYQQLSTQIIICILYKCFFYVGMSCETILNKYFVIYKISFSDSEQNVPPMPRMHSLNTADI